MSGAHGAACVAGAHTGSVPLLVVPDRDVRVPRSPTCRCCPRTPRVPRAGGRCREHGHGIKGASKYSKKRTTGPGDESVRPRSLLPARARSAPAKAFALSEPVSYQAHAARRVGQPTRGRDCRRLTSHSRRPTKIKTQDVRCRRQRRPAPRMQSHRPHGAWWC